MSYKGLIDDLSCMEKQSAPRWAREFISQSDKALASIPGSFEQADAARRANNVMHTMTSQIKGKHPTTSSAAYVKMTPQEFYNLKSGQKQNPRRDLWDYHNSWMNKKPFIPLTEKQTMNTLQSRTLQRKINELGKAGNSSAKRAETDRSSGDLTKILNSYKNAFEIIDELMEKTSAFRTNFTQMVESSLKNADPMRKRHPPKPITEIKKLREKGVPQNKLWKNPNLEKNAGDVPWHGIRAAIKDFDKDRKAAKAAYDALPDAAKEQVKRQRKEAEKHLLKGAEF